jgi:hypothetical protein
MLRRPFAVTTLAVAALTLIGCAGGPKSGSSAPGNGTIISSPTERAAYAGHAQFPQTQPALNDLTVAAIVSRDKKQLKLYNFGKQAIRNVDVWVNGSFVTRIGGIAPQSSVVISTTEIYNGLGHSLASRGEEVSRVQLDDGGRLFNLMGPASE